MLFDIFVPVLSYQMFSLADYYGNSKIKLHIWVVHVPISVNYIFSMDLFNQQCCLYRLVLYLTVITRLPHLLLIFIAYFSDTVPPTLLLVFIILNVWCHSAASVQVATDLLLNYQSYILPEEANNIRHMKSYVLQLRSASDFIQRKTILLAFLPGGYDRHNLQYSLM